MKKLLSWIQDENWYRHSQKGLFIAFMTSFLMLTSYAAASVTKVYMVDKNQYFVLDASKDNFLNMNPMGEIANMFFGFHKGFIKMIAWLIEQSYSFDLYQLIEKEFNTLFEPIKNTFWNGFFPIAGGVFILSLLILITFHGRASTAFEGFVKGMAIITFALWFMKSPANSMNGLKNITDGVNAELVKNSYTEVKVEDQYKEIADQFYTTFVVEIWRILNFGSEGFDNEDIKVIQEKYEPRILNAAPGSDERAKITEELREEVKISESSWVGSIFLLMILSIPDIIIMTILSSINLASDVFTIGLALMGPIIFLFAILPNYGSRLFMSWLSKILFFFAITVATTILMTYYIGLTNILLASRKDFGGITGVLAVKDAILIAAFIFRDKLTFAAQSAAQGRRGMERSMEQMSFKQEAVEGKNRVVEKAVNIKDKSINKASNYRVKSLEKKEKERLKTNGVDPIKMSSEARTELAEEALEARLQHRMVTAKNEAVEKEERFGIKFEPDYGDLTEHVKKYEAGEDPFTGAERRKMVSDIEKNEKAWGDPREFVDKYKVDFARMDSDQRRTYSEDYLMKRFEEQKEAAENEAKETGKAPKYDNWTREKIARKERGEPVFTEKEISAFSENIRRSEKSGENVQKTLKHKRRNSSDYIDPEDEESESKARRPDTDAGGPKASPNNENEPNSGNSSDFNYNHTYKHEHEHNVHYDDPARTRDDQTVDIKKVKNTGVGKGEVVERPGKQTDKKTIDPKSTEAVLKGVNEVIKNQQEEKKDIDETQEQLKEIQRTTEQNARTVNAKINKLEGEKAEEETEA